MIATLFEDFSEPAAPGPVARAAVDDTARRVEEARVAAFEEGYRSGWDDAAKSAETDKKTVSEELARNLKDLGFTYFEARGEIMELVRAFLAEMMDKLFPALLSDSAAATLVSEIAGIAEDRCDGQMTILVSPEDAPTIAALLELAAIPQVRVVEEPALASGQARLKAEPTEAAIDADRIIRNLRESLGPASPRLTAFKDIAHG